MKDKMRARFSFLNIIDMQNKYCFLLLCLLIISLFYNCDKQTQKNSDSRDTTNSDTIINEKQEVLTRDAGTLKFITQGMPSKNIMGYWQYIPEKHHQNQTWPILLFLHGGGMGEKPDINRVKKYGPLKHVLEESLSNHSPAVLLKKFIIISPILPENPKNFTLWIDNIKALDAIIDSTIINFKGDPSRLYITGSSRGGSGAWRFPKHSKHSIAAIVPVCGYYMKLVNLNALIDIPVWTTCNTGDWHYNNHKRAVSYIEKHGGEQFFLLDTAAPDNPSFLKKKHVFTSFAKKGHDAWTETYASRQIYQWMLNFRNINGKIICEENR